MNAQQENRVSMYYKVRLFFTTHLGTINTAVPAITATVATFNSRLDQLATLDQTATEANDGYATQKQLNRAELRDKALTVAGAIKALALSNGDMPLAAKTDTNKSTLDRMRDVDFLFWCENLYTIATTNATAIIPMGIAATKLTSYNAAFTKYKASIQAPADQRSESLAAGIAVDNKIVEIDASLAIIDALMETQRIDQNMLYNKYKADRSIDDNAASNSPADLIKTAEPGFTTLYNVPYNDSRTFTIRNNGTSPVDISLSNSANAFDNRAFTLLPGTESTQLSRTLAPNGNLLIAENKTTTPIQLEVWIVE
jgi:hypothetical protein